MAQPAADYDNPWKEAVRVYLEPFLRLFFPNLWEAVDWSRGYEFLDTQLRQVTRDAEIGPRHADLLVRVWLKDGSDRWLLIHIEIQSQPQSDFSKRMFVYHYRSFDIYGRPVVSLAVLADASKRWGPREYRHESFGSEMRLRYRAVKLAHLDPVKLLEEHPDNPFTVVVGAHLQSQRARKGQEWLAAKTGLVRRLYKQGWGREDAPQLFWFLDWLLHLPPELEREFREEVHRLEEDTHVHISPALSEWEGRKAVRKADGRALPRCSSSFSRASGAMSTKLWSGGSAGCPLPNSKT